MVIMKVKIFLVTLLLAMVGLLSVQAQKVTLYKTSGQTVEYEVSELDSIVFSEAGPVLVSKIVLSETSITLRPDEMKRLTATVLPSNAANPAVTWTSSNDNVAEVNQGGRIIANDYGTCIITCSATDGSGVKATCQVTVSSGTTPDPSNYGWVDLGLPSGTLWATCNVGANSPEEYGDYFAWGETQPKAYYNWSTYAYCNDAYETLTKYCAKSSYGYNGFTDTLTELEADDDAATKNWGNDWQTPSHSQFQELYSYTTATWTTQGGVSGRLCTASNGNSIFLPSAGIKGDSYLMEAGSNGYYWMRTLNINNCDNAYRLYSHSYTSDWDYWGYRYYGQSVRPVRKQTSQTQNVTQIVLDKTSLSLKPNDTYTLAATVLPSNASNKVVTWTSSKTNVATVSSNGLVTAKAKGSCVITCSATDGSGVKASCQVTVTSGTTPDPVNHEWVDLGLPSGTLWATCNVGASSPEEYGDYFAWGETGPHDGWWWWDGYIYCNGSSNTLTKYCTQSGYGYNGFTDNLTELLPEDDAATANWGSDWRMPSEEQIMELYNNTTQTWTTQNGKYGQLCTGPSGNSIFLPAAGYYDMINFYNAGSSGFYWSRSLYTGDSNNAICMTVSSGTISYGGNYRYYGYSVRPVRKEASQTTKYVTQIVLDKTSLSLQPNDTYTLTATVLPSDATNKTVTWTSSNVNVATVSSNGLVTAKAYGSCVITCSATDGSGVKAECQVRVKTQDTMEYVDLGLPSGTLWATCNVGASSPEECGDYFAWGETEPKNNYSWSTYKWCNGTSKTITKYCAQSEYGYNGFVDTLTELLPEDDAATANWGSDWQMPSKEQIEELRDNTTATWTTYNEMNGILFTSSNGNSFFMPASGAITGTYANLVGKSVSYYSRSLCTTSKYGSDVYVLSWDDYSGISSAITSRSYGFCVRPVRKQASQTTKYVTQIVLNEASLSLQLNDTYALVATVLPSDATNKALAWESSNEAVATVSSHGLVTAKANGSCVIICSATDGSSVKAECSVTVYTDNSGTINGREYVDLGLPSRTLWATCNVGASSPEEFGNYFAWGETEPKDNYDWSTYKWCNGTSKMTKYCAVRYDGYNGFTDSLTELLPEDDAATANWGSDWQMPSEGQMTELYDSSYTTTEWAMQGGVDGLRITSKSNGNSNSIFLPAAGFRVGTRDSEGNFGCYWSRSLKSSESTDAYHLNFNSGLIFMDDYSRYFGRSVRPVRVK